MIQRSLLLVAMLAACASPGAPVGDEDAPSPEDPPATETESGEVNLSLAVSPAEPPARRPVTFTLRVSANEPVTLEFSTGQRYDFEVRDASGEVVWKWSNDRVFTMALGREQVRAGEERIYEESWTPEAPGRHSVRGVVTASNYELSTASDFEVGG